jgi:hypothetical protein
MTSSPPLWTRPHHEPVGHTASVILFAFARAPLDLSRALSRSRHGLPEGFDFDTLDISQHERASSPDWFAGFLTPEMQRMAARDVGNEAAQLPLAGTAYGVQIETLEPADLGYLQGAWAAARFFCDCGASLVADAHAIRWRSARQVLGRDPALPFALEEEVSLVFETEPTDDLGHLTHTRGMAKFGRPDVLLLGATPADADVCGSLLNALALRAAEGAPLEAGQSVAPRGLVPRMLRAYEPGGAHPQVHLNNDGLVLDIRGWALRGAGPN